MQQTPSDFKRESPIFRLERLSHYLHVYLKIGIEFNKYFSLFVMGATFFFVFADDIRFDWLLDKWYVNRRDKVVVV